MISRPGTPNPSAGLPSARSQTANALHPKFPIQTPQQFYDWFSLIDRSVAHSQEAHFRAHLSSVAEHLETCDKLVLWIDEIDGEVERMLKAWKSVEEVKQALRDGDFKPNCALVLLDFFVRHGILTAEDEGYIEIVARLHRRLEFPTAS